MTPPVRATTLAEIDRLVEPLVVLEKVLKKGVDTLVELLVNASEVEMFAWL